MSAAPPADLSRNPQHPILVVDDDPVQHALIQKYLQNWQVIFAHSAVQALKILERDNIVVVITDLRMPGMDGLEMLRRIKRSNGIVQVIVITGSEQLQDLINALEAGASDFLLKPLTRQALEEALDSALARINRWKATTMALFQKTRGAKQG